MQLIEKRELQLVCFAMESHLRSILKILNSSFHFIAPLLYNGHHAVYLGSSNKHDRHCSAFT